MASPSIWILPCRLILEEWKQQVLPDYRIGVEQYGPSWGYHIHSVYILVTLMSVI